MIQWCVTSSKNLHSYLFMSSPMTTRECLAAGPRAYGHDVRSMCRLVLHSSLLSSPQPVLPVLLPFFPPISATHSFFPLLLLFPPMPSVLHPCSVRGCSSPAASGAQHPQTARLHGEGDFLCLAFHYRQAQGECPCASCKAAVARNSSRTSAYTPGAVVVNRPPRAQVNLHCLG